MLETDELSRRLKSARGERGRAPDAGPAPAESRIGALAALRDDCQDFARGLGYPHFLAALGADGAPPVSLTNYPPAWTRFYDTARLAAIDPLLRRSLRSHCPFTWADLDLTTRESQPYLAAAITHGIADGLIVPIHGPLVQGLFSLSGAPAPPPGQDRDRQFAACWLFAGRLIGPLLTHTGLAASLNSGTRALTTSQLAVLALLAEGQTLKRCARSLGVHPRTVQGSLKRALANLGVQTREQAIRRAALMGLIGPAFESLSLSEPASPRPDTVRRTALGSSRSRIA